MFHKRYLILIIANDRGVPKTVADISLEVNRVIRDANSKLVIHLS